MTRLTHSLEQATCVASGSYDQSTVVWNMQTGEVGKEGGREGAKEGRRGARRAICNIHDLTNPPSLPSTPRRNKNGRTCTTPPSWTWLGGTTPPSRPAAPTKQSSSLTLTNPRRNPCRHSGLVSPLSFPSSLPPSFFFLVGSNWSR